MFKLIQIVAFCLVSSTVSAEEPIEAPVTPELPAGAAVEPSGEAEAPANPSGEAEAAVEPSGEAEAPASPSADPAPTRVTSDVDLEVVGDPTFVARRGPADWSRDFELKMDDGSGARGSCSVGLDLQPISGRLKTGTTESEGRAMSLGLAPSVRMAQCTGVATGRDGQPLVNLLAQARFDMPAGVALSKEMNASLAPRAGAVAYLTSVREKPEDIQYKGGAFAGMNMWGPSIGNTSPRSYVPSAGVFVGAAKKFQVPFTEGVNCTAAGDVAAGFMGPTNGTQTILNHDPVSGATNFGFGYRRTGTVAGVDARVYCTAEKGWKLKWPF